MLSAQPGGFTLALRGQVLLRHAPDAPCAFIGRGTARMDMLHGNFDIADDLFERAPLTHAVVDDTLIHLARRAGDAPALTLRLEKGDDSATLHVVHAEPGANRLWLRVHAEDSEAVWGCGEQMSYLNLRGRRFPLWTSEPGVGRDKTTEITFRADARGRAGGDYFTTNHPQPSFLTSRRCLVHLQTTAYAVFDFRAPGFHELEAWAIPERIEFLAAPDLPALVGRAATRFGRHPPLPDWALDGMIVGLKDGANSYARLERYLDAGVHVTGLWCEDWAGVRHTSFGTRLFWDWQWNPARHPDLPARIQALAARGIRFLGYVSPYLCNDGALFHEAEAAGYFARNAQGGTLLVDFGEFACGVLDFTNPEAADWFATRIIGANMIGIGMAGWMADFGEYLPIDAHLANGVPATLMHNAWPPIWAEVNARAVAAAGRTGDIVFFMRAGFTGSQAHCPLLWAGDQSVDFSRHDGLATVITGALSAGLLGHAYHHSDIGGYTSLFGNVRTLELIQRWAEMAAFTPVMRSHEGNRPRHNLQIDESPEALAHLARMVRIHRALLPYVRTLVAEAATNGLPLQRPLFLHHDDPATYAIHDAYLYGPDLLVAPVHEAGADTWQTYLPTGAAWVHVWTGKRLTGGQHVTVPAPIGQPPVFYREGTPHEALFVSLRDL